MSRDADSVSVVRSKSVLAICCTRKLNLQGRNKPLESWSEIYGVEEESAVGYGVCFPCGIDCGGVGWGGGGGGGGARETGLCEYGSARVGAGGGSLGGGGPR